MTRTSSRLALVLLLSLAAFACTGPSRAEDSPGVLRPAAERPTTPLSRLEARYTELLLRHRPDLAERYVAAPTAERFVTLDEATVGAHLNELRKLLAAAEPLPAGAHADSLRARLLREIAETEPGGALRRDALLWLDVVDAAARAPFALGAPRGCDRTRRAALQLRTLPEALRAATVLMRGAAPPEPRAFETRLEGLERLLRQDLPARIEACKESRWRAEFVEADSLAAASLAQFRRWLTPGE